MKFIFSSCISLLASPVFSFPILKNENMIASSRKQMKRPKNKSAVIFFQLHSFTHFLNSFPLFAWRKYIRSITHADRSEEAQAGKDGLSEISLEAAFLRFPSSLPLFLRVRAPKRVDRHRRAWKA